MIYSGVFDLAWWVHALIVLALTHLTIIAVTIFLHRHQTHRALDLHPLVSHFFRFWLWLTTGMVTREWAAVHRKHHAKVETPEDPHSPQIYGIARVLFLGVLLYVKAAHDRETLEKYGHGTPEDWIERNLYSRFPKSGVVVMALADILLFGALPGLAIFAVQMVWIPFWAAGVINGLAHVRHVATVPRIDPDKTVCDRKTLEALIHNRYYVLARYTQAVRDVCMKEVNKLGGMPGSERKAEIDPRTLGNLARWLRFYTWDVKARHPIDLEPVRDIVRPA